MTQELFDKIDVNVLLLLEDNNIYEVFSRGHVPKIELKTIEDLWTHMIKSDIDYIKKHLVDIDSVLTDDDVEALEEAEKDLKSKKTKRL